MMMIMEVAIMLTMMMTTMMMMMMMMMMMINQLDGRLPQLAVIVDALVSAMGSIGYISMILFLFLYVFAIMGTCVCA